MPHIIPGQPPGVILAVAVLAAVALAALVVAVLEHRRVTSHDDQLGDLIGSVYRHGKRLEAHAATIHLLSLDYEPPASASADRYEQIKDRIAYIRAESVVRADELDRLIRELEAPETQHALPEGWSVVTGDAATAELNADTPRAALTVVGG